MRRRGDKSPGEVTLVASAIRSNENADRRDIVASVQRLLPAAIVPSSEPRKRGWRCYRDDRTCFRHFERLRPDHSITRLPPDEPLQIHKPSYT